MKLYSDLATWWPLLSAPADYAEEAAFYTQQLLSDGDQPARTLLELGSGGGNNASFMKKQFSMTLVDLSPGMQAWSRKLNPECEHVEGDMRVVRLGRLFDRVFIHDAIVYMTTLADLRCGPRGEDGALSAFGAGTRLVRSVCGRQAEGVSRRLSNQGHRLHRSTLSNAAADDTDYADPLFQMQPQMGLNRSA